MFGGECYRQDTVVGVSILSMTFRMGTDLSINLCGDLAPVGLRNYLAKRKLCF